MYVQHNNGTGQQVLLLQDQSQPTYIRQQQPQQQQYQIIQVNSTRYTHPVIHTRMGTFVSYIDLIFLIC